MEQLLDAIIYCDPADPVSGNKFLKYRKIKDDYNRIGKFMTFAKGFPNAKYVNFYYRHRPKPNFKERIYLE